MQIISNDTADFQKRLFLRIASQLRTFFPLLYTEFYINNLFITVHYKHEVKKYLAFDKRVDTHYELIRPCSIGPNPTIIKRPTVVPDTALIISPKPMRNKYTLLPSILEMLRQHNEYFRSG